MIRNLQSIFGTREAERIWVEEIHALIRAENFREAQDKLTDCLTGQHHPIAKAALAMSPDQLSFGDWGRLNRFLSRPVHGMDMPAAAIGLDLSNYADIDSGEPSVEVSLYGDRPNGPFPFSTAKRDDFLAASRHNHGPWQGSFDDCSTIALHGFAPLNSLLLQYRRGGTEAKRGTEDYAIYGTASLLLGLRFHQLVVRTFRGHGLTRRVPVLVAGHGEPFVASSVYFPDKIVPLDTRPESEVEREHRRRDKPGPTPELVEAGLRHLIGGRRGPLVDLGVSILSGFLVERSLKRKQRRS